MTQNYSLSKANLLLITLLLFLLSNLSYAQLSGTKNIPGDYATIAEAVTDLNTQGVGSGGVTFNVAAGHTETISATILLTATGTAADPIVFQKSGTGANPLITAYTGTATPGSASPDGIWALSGADYVTIDGIDLYDPNTTNPETMEFGYGLFKASATNGCQNVTIKNCTITLNRVNNASGTSPMVEGSVGILVINSTRTAATTALTPTASSGSNSFNKFYSNTIQNCNYGIVLSGYAATSGVGPSPNPSTFLGDMENDIGGTSASTGNTILNYGGAPSATNPAAGIRAINQWSINISYNTINNNNGSGVNHPNTLRGIYAQSGTSANATINNNNVTIKGGGTTQQVAAIENGIGGTPASNTVSISNNTITGDYLTATSGVFYGIYNNSVAPTTLNIQNNTVQNLSYSAATLTGSGAVYPIYTTGTNAASTFNITGNTVNNITRTGTTGGTTIGIFASTGTSGMTYNVNNNTVSNMSIDGSGTASTMYGIQTATGTITVNNNNVYNLQCIKTSGTSALYGIYNISSPTNETINNNNVYGLTHNGTGIVYGIYYNTITGTRTMSGNTVYNITGAGTTVAGIYNVSSSPSVFRNRVYNIQSTSSGTPTVSGIIQGTLGLSGFANIYNNYISEIKAPNATFTTQSAIVRGINIITTTSTTNIYLYYNTVYLDASSTGSNFSSAAIFHTANATATTANLIMRNNIFVNNSTPNGTGVTVAYWRSSTALNNFDNSSNNNLFYAGTPSATNLIFFDGTNSDQTIADYKTRVTPRDASSFSENPPFVDVSSSPYDLHIDPSTPTQIESGGIPISTPVAITTDFDGDTRNATTPDLGADEGDFTGLDLTPPNITYTALGNGIVAGARAFNNVTITDPSGVNTSSGTKPRVYYKKSTDPNDATGWVYVEADNSSSPFNFTIDYSLLNDGVVNVGDQIQYFVVAQDLVSTPNVGINSGTFNSTPSSVNLTAAAFPIGGTINSYNIFSSISGTKTVGTGGDYPSLTGAGGLFADINSKVVSGNITAQIISDLTEDGTNALNQMSTEGGSWTLTIQPDAATTRTISGTYAGGLIRLNGADNVTIDGRYGGVGNYLTFNNTNTTANSGVIQLISLGTGQGCENVTIRNTTIASGTSTAITFGIHAGGSSFASNGADHDNLSIIDNVINTASNGILVFGNASTSSGGADNLLISGNTVTCSTSVQSIGIRVRNALNSTITQNTLDIQQSVSNAPVGISLETGVNNTVVSRNLVQRSVYTAAVGYGGRGIVVGTGLTSSNITLVNNVIHTISGDNYSSFGNSSSMGIGIGVDGSTSTLSVTTGGVNIYYNSVNMYNTYNRAATSCLTAAIYIGSGSSNLDIRNNIFANSMDNTGNTTSKSYAIYSTAPASAFSTINYNNYYAPAPEGVLGFISSADVTTLSAWQTATGQDANSISANPQFNSNTNLQPQLGSPVVAAGTPITGITTDILGVSRNATNPSMGAYEEGVDGAPPAITYTALGNTNSTSNRTLTATITDATGVPTSGTLQPRIWFRRSAPTPSSWGSTQGVLQSGTGTSGTWQFTIDYSVIGVTPTTNDFFQYYVVAQDEATTPNIATNPAGGVHTDVNTQTTPPGTPNQYKIVGPPLSGTYTIGSTMYRNITGLNIQFEKKIVKVEKEVIVENTTTNNNDVKAERIREELEIIAESTLPYAPGTLQKITVEEEIWVPMLNGMPYEGKLVANKGEYNLPEGIEATYSTITAALADLNERGVSGPVTFLLQDADYSTGETFPLLINIQNENLPTSTNTVTFKPDDAVTTAITGTLASNALIRINNSYIIINGTYDSDPNGRNLTITNNSATSPQVIRIGSVGTTTVVGTQVKNCNITNGSQTSSAIVIMDDGGTTAGYFNNLLIHNNSIKKAYIGIYANAIVSSGNGGITISNNDLNSTGTDAIRQAGIYAQGCDGATVSNNNVGNLEAASAENDRGIWFATGTVNSSVTNNTISTLNCTASGNAPIGILISSGVASANITVSQNTVSGVTTAGSGTASGISVSGATEGVSITRNLVNNVKNTNTVGWGSNGIWLASTSTTANINVVNNVVYDVASYGYIGGGVADNGYGIIVASGAGYNIYFNSVNMNTSQTVSGSPAAFNITSSVTEANAVNVMNNIFANNQSQTGEKYSVYYGGTSATIFNNLNYNNYFTTGTNLGYFNNLNQADLAALKTAIGKDAYSIQGDPGFTSMTNLQPDPTNVNSWNVANKAVHISGVNVDYTGASRPTTATSGVPDIGAYEFATPSVTPPVATSSGAPAPSTTTTYSQGGQQLASITWGSGGTVPTSIDVVYYTGVTPTGPSVPKARQYWDITPTGGTGYSYDITLTYDEAQLNGIDENNLHPAKSTDNGATWTGYTTVGTGAGQFQRNTVNNTITIYGLDGFSWFGLGDIGSPLPIELTSFTATSKGRNVELNWQTATEVQSSKFVVERKSDKNDTWVNVAELQAAGNSNSPRDYSYVDKKLNSGDYSYRLKMVDIDGTFSYSDLVETNVELPKEYAISQNYPNPFNPSTRIDYQLPFDSKVMIELYSITGERVAMLSDKIEEAGYYTVEVNGSQLGLASGVYIYRIVAQNLSNGQQFMNVKKMMMVK